MEVGIKTATEARKEKEKGPGATSSEVRASLAPARPVASIALQPSASSPGVLTRAREATEKVSWMVGG